LMTSINKAKLSSSQWSSEECVIVLYRLWDCGLTDESCAALASALRSNPSHLRQLDMSRNELGNLGVNLLSEVLGDPHCNLKKLELRYCGLTDEGCAALASALRSNPSHLRDLDLSGNKLGDSVMLLSDNKKCVIVLYRLWDCGVTDEGCAALASALRSNPSHLRQLDLSRNKLQDLDVKLLCAALKDPQCKLEILELSYCGITDEGCAALASALRSNPSHLRHLNLIGNKQQKLEEKLSDCGITDEGCAALASALRSNPSHLRQLILSGNEMGNSVNLLSVVLEDPHCKLEILQ
uniref:Uncharacterized protein n=1 Tax=Sinocyclocheilus rhinocerous TaxID=307959 RepID=A0A673FNN2_9TELE